MNFLSGGVIVKKCLMMLILPLLLAGCAAQETLETVADPVVEIMAPKPAQISVRLPDGAVAPVLDSDAEQVYSAEDYEIMIETLSAGDLDATIQKLSGYDRENLTVMETQQGDASRYEFVWTSIGEHGSRLGRGVILDDGNYHYCLSVLRDSQTKRNTQIVWSDVFESFSLI